MRDLLGGKEYTTYELEYEATNFYTTNGVQ